MSDDPEKPRRHKSLNAARQAAFRERLKKAGKVRVWLTPDEKAAFAALPFLQADLASAQSHVAALQKQVLSLESQLSSAHARPARRVAPDPSIVGRMPLLSNERRITAIKTALLSDPDYTNGGRKAVTASWTLKARQDKIAKATQAAKTAATHLRTLVAEFVDMDALASSEAEVLNAAAIVLNAVGEAGDTGKLAAKQAAQKREVIEAKHQKLATDALAATFGTLDSRTALLITAWRDRHNYHLKQLPELVAGDHFNFRYTDEELKREAQEQLRSLILKELAAGKTADEAVAALKADFESQKATLWSRYSVLATALESGVQAAIADKAAKEEAAAIKRRSL